MERRRMLFRLLLGFVILITTNNAADEVKFNTECITIKEKPHSCLHFVYSFEHNHEQAFQFCFDNFRGAPIAIQDYKTEVPAIIQRYFWWDQSVWDPTQFLRLRLGMLIWSKTEIRRTDYNPDTQSDLSPDMEIWNRSFPKKIKMPFNPTTYPGFDYKELDTEVDPKRRIYIGIDPYTQNYSIIGFEYKTPFVCEAPRFPKIYCEEGWSLHMKSRSCLKVVDSSMDFNTAVEKCKEMGSSLASVNDETENKLILRMINAAQDFGNRRVWIGLRWDADKSGELNGLRNVELAKKIREISYNLDGTPVSEFHLFDLWNGFNDNSQGNCILYEVKSSDQKWHDSSCTTTRAWALCRKMSITEPYEL